MDTQKKDHFLSEIYESQRLVELIENSADELTRRFIREIRASDDTPKYHTWDEDELYRRAYNVYSQLGKWISRETTKADIAKHYMALGAQRREEGFLLSEVVEALAMTRRFLWRKVLSEGLLDTVLDLTQALKLNHRVILFFDRAIYYTVMGYEKGK